jgi:L-xylulokinase
MPRYLLGIDNGNTVCKATLFDEQGQVMGSTSAKVKTHYPKAGWSERNVSELWQTNARNIRKLIQKSGIHPTEIAGIGSTGHGNGLYLLDKKGQPLKGIQSLDSRAGELVEAWKAEGLQQKVFAFTQQEFWASQTNSLLAWHQRFEPQTYAQIGAVLLCKDLINYCLTGEIATDFTDISATNLLNIHTRQYDGQLLDLYRLADIQEALPPIFHSHQLIGNVSKSAAKQTGLAVGTPVVAGMLDADASMLGSGVYKAGQVGVIAGTWSVNGLISPTPLNDPHLAMTALFAVPDTYLTLEASATSITNLEWFVNQFCQEERRLAKRRGVSTHQVCDEMVSQTQPSSLIFHPFLHGSNVQANARAGFYGLAGWHTKADMLRAVYEGIVFGHLSHVEKLRKAGAEINSVRLTGGGSRSPVLAQLFADVLNTEIEIPATTETGTWGVAVAAGVGIGMFKNYEEAIKLTVKMGATYQPNFQQTAYFQTKYHVYQDFIEEMKASWNKLNRFC